MSKESEESSIFTTAVHSGEPPAMEGAKPHGVPIVSSAAYTYDSWADISDAIHGGPGSFVYARYGGTTQLAFEDAIATVEKADAAVCFSSGMAALHAGILTIAHSGGHMLVAEALYGTTTSLAQWMDANMDITAHTVDMTDLEATRLMIDEIEPTALICEVVTNPTMRVIDLPTIAMMAHAVGAQVLVDNTFATPYLLHPLEVGADIVAHSTTKFINGHGDVLGGVLAGPSDLCHVAYGHRKRMGAMMSPFDAWLTLRGLRTLPLRMRQACDNAMQIATWLKEHPAVSQVMYPGDPDHPQHDTARSLFREGVFGAMMSFELADADQAKAFAFMDALQVCQRLASLGVISSSVSHPATTSHVNLTPEERAAQGISDGLIRLSVGIENPADIIADLEQGFAAIKSG
jgi:cystathionine gamma-synthase/methionine-gamma-lyase